MKPTATVYRPNLPPAVVALERDPDAGDRIDVHGRAWRVVSATRATPLVRDEAHWIVRVR